MRSRVQE